MSLRKDSFERILAFSNLEEAKNMDLETTRWKACCTVKLCVLQVFFKEKIGEWKKEWSSTHWR